MSELTTGALMKAMAAVINSHKASLGLVGVSSPAINNVPKSPWCMVRQSMAMPSLIEKGRAGLQIVRPRIDIVLLVVSDEKRPGDASRLDGLVDPILDLFDANAYGGNVNAAFTGLLTQSVDRIWQEASVRRLALEWGEAGYCHAAIITLDAQFSRRASLP